jgi:hypothetical protein
MMSRRKFARSSLDTVDGSSSRLSVQLFHGSTFGFGGLGQLQGRRGRSLSYESAPDCVGLHSARAGGGAQALALA